MMLAAGSIGGVEFHLRVGNCLDSVVSTFDDQLDVSRSEAIYTLKLLADTCTTVRKCVPRVRRQVWEHQALPSGCRRRTAALRYSCCLYMCLQEVVCVH